MNLYDFDKTIYKYDSSIKFFFFCAKKSFRVFLQIFPILFFGILHLFGFISTKNFKEKFFKFLKYIDVDKLVDEFWDREIKNINSFYTSQKLDSDVIVSASPTFLVNGAMKRINPSATLICTNMEKHTGKINGDNIKGENKVVAIRNVFKETKFENAYSDSVTDLPMLYLAENKYIVVKDKVYVYSKQKVTFTSKIKSMIKLMRPKHYLKNVLIILPLFFSKIELNWNIILNLLYGLISFSLMCSVVYIINDIKDAKNDRLNSKKRTRPIASYMVKPWEAIIFAIILLALSILFHYLIFGFKILPLLILLSYLSINLSYSFGLKNVPIIDVFLLALCYLIRVFYGGRIVVVSISAWFYLTILCASLFMGLGKRRNEINSENINVRKVNKLYTNKFLDKNMYTYLSLTLAFYSLWAVSIHDTLNQINSIILLATIPLVYIIMMRYSLNIEDNSNSGDPINVMFKDKWLIVLCVIYVVAIIIALYAQIPFTINY